MRVGSVTPIALSSDKSFCLVKTCTSQPSRHHHRKQCSARKIIAVHDNGTRRPRSRESPRTCVGSGGTRLPYGTTCWQPCNQLLSGVSWASASSQPQLHVLRYIFASGSYRRGTPRGICLMGVWRLYLYEHQSEIAGSVAVESAVVIVHRLSRNGVRPSRCARFLPGRSSIH